MNEPADHDLLAEFARSQSEAAFAELVARHVSLVYSGALRFTRNPDHAQEITQAVFIILAKKAGSLRQGTVLSGWLYQTARLAAANFMKGEFRRQQREQEAYMQFTLNQPDDAWEQIAPVLDDAMGKLGETDRAALVLRYFENKTSREIAAALRMEEDAAQKRVTRALKKLRALFVKRGVTLTATVIAGAVAANSVQAAPVGLAVTVTATAASGTAVAASTLTLVKEALNIMAWMKAKTVIAVGVAILCTTAITVAVVEVTTGPSPEWILKKVRDQYASLSTYGDIEKTVVSTVLIAGRQTNTVFTSSRLQMMRPDSYRFERGHSNQIVHIGWSAGDGDFMLLVYPDHTNYVRLSTMGLNPDSTNDGLAGHIPSLFFSKPALSGSVSFQSQESNCFKRPDETVNGVDCYVVEAVVKSNPYFRGSLWVGKRDFLVYQEKYLSDVTISDADISRSLVFAGKPATEEAVRGRKKEIALFYGPMFFWIKTHENIATNQSFTKEDFIPKIPAEITPVPLEVPKEMPAVKKVE